MRCRQPNWGWPLVALQCIAAAKCASLWCHLTCAFSVHRLHHTYLAVLMYVRDSSCGFSVRIVGCAGSDLVPACALAEASVRLAAGEGRFWTPGLTVSHGSRGTSVAALVRGELFLA